ncbi:MAG: DUF4942 domain-containing protein [Ruminococcus sp.]|uniref:class I SAM-dependent methyltransferase n=1 Tax=Ruminococcus sp. TaxID=41978 RepID=UPI0025D0F035|nr:DUF4942 domain-containing protein [Ruminococcus sp.]MBD9049186.1 DUF4942 domain-containing protein [Ruminococcus sp.]
MTNIQNLTENPTESEFYPTPTELVQKMLECVDFKKVKTILEPSAGKGDILQVLARKECSTSPYSDRFDVDCIEIDINLRQILKYNFSEEKKRSVCEKINELSPKRTWDCEINEYITEKISEVQKMELEKYKEEKLHFFESDIHIVGDDFLSFHTYKRYDLIIMNPPFSCGEKHLLKAIEMQKNGGQIVCLLNAQTLLNPFTNERKMLVKKLEELNATIEYISGAFSNAERRTDVDVALVYICCIADESYCYSNILDSMKKANKYEEKEYEAAELTINDYILSTVQRYNLDVSMGVKLIEEYKALEPYLKGSFDEQNRYSKSLLTLETPENDTNVNSYIKSVRMKYWNALLRNKSIMSKFTTELREHYINLVSDLSDYDVSEFNIKTLIAEMNSKIYEGIEKSIVRLFDKFTEEHSYYPECKKTIHYFDGWVTNKAHKIGKKVIVPFYCYNSNSYAGGRYNTFEIANMLKDVEKVFDYFGGSNEIFSNVTSILELNLNGGNTRKIEFKYFYVSVFKKGTVHIEFKDQKLVDRFNIYVCKHKNWLPPAYGKIHYADMNTLEREVIDSYEGKESYEKVLAEQDYYLAPVVPENALLLASGM